MAHTLKTSAGILRTNNPWLDRNIVSEVIDQDCYRLRQIAKIWKPAIIFDVGMGSGVVSILARSLWPDSLITGFELDPDVARLACDNVPGAAVHTGCVGYAYRAADILHRVGAADLLCIDCEGGEVPFFYDLFAANLIGSFQVIVGEWHQWPGRALIEAALRPAYFTVFHDPPAAAGPWNYFAAVNRAMPLSRPVCAALGIAMPEQT